MKVTAEHIEAVGRDICNFKDGAVPSDHASVLIAHKEVIANSLNKILAKEDKEAKKDGAKDGVKDGARDGAVSAPASQQK